MTRESIENARAEYQRAKDARVYKTPGEALKALCSMERRATDEEVIQWLADLQARSDRELNADDCYTLASARAIIERLTKELQAMQPSVEKQHECPRCENCNKSLSIKQGIVWLPGTTTRAPTNYFGGFVCSERCDNNRCLNKLTLMRTEDQRVSMPEARAQIEKNWNNARPVDASVLIGSVTYDTL